MAAVVAPWIRRARARELPAGCPSELIDHDGPGTHSVSDVESDIAKIVLCTSTCDPIAALGVRVAGRLRLLETPGSGRTRSDGVKGQSKRCTLAVGVDLCDAARPSWMNYWLLVQLMLT